MKYSAASVCAILLFALVGCTNASTSSAPSALDASDFSDVAVSRSLSAISSSSASNSIEQGDRIGVVGSWRYVNPETDVMTPNAYSFKFNADGTMEYVSGWENSETMEYRAGTYTEKDGTITVSMSTTRITDEGLSYGYTDKDYNAVIAYENIGQELHLTLLSGDIPFVYMDYDVTLVFHYQLPQE